MLKVNRWRSILINLDLQIHVPIFVDNMQKAVAELKRQQALGKIRYYAISNFGPQTMKEFVDAGGVAVSNQVIHKVLAFFENFVCMIGVFKKFIRQNSNI